MTHYAYSFIISIMTYQLLAIVLIICPSLAPKNPSKELRCAVQEIGHLLELRKSQYGSETFFPYHVEQIKADWLESKANYWPHLWELERFPNRKWVYAEAKQNRTFKGEITSHQVLRLHHYNAFQNWNNQLDQEFLILDVLSDASSEHLEVATRRRALCRLRKLMGSEAFYDGGMIETSSHWED